jgi:hypothetical protein
MGEAKKRGSREQRVALAAPRPPKLGADERRRLEAEAFAQGLAKGLSLVLAPLGVMRSGAPFH